MSRAELTRTLDVRPQRDGLPARRARGGGAGRGRLQALARRAVGEGGPRSWSGRGGRAGGDRGRPRHRRDHRGDGRASAAVCCGASAAPLPGPDLGRGRPRAASSRRSSTQVDLAAALSARSARRAPVGRPRSARSSSPSPHRSAAHDGRALAPLHLHWPQVPLRELLRRAPRRRPADRRDRCPGRQRLEPLGAGREPARRRPRRLDRWSTSAARRSASAAASTIGGHLFEGARGYAIEPGHITVNPAGRPCTCGSTGCLEVEADSRALLRAYGRSRVTQARLGGAVQKLLDAAAAGEADGDRARSSRPTCRSGSASRA